MLTIWLIANKTLFISNILLKMLEMNNEARKHKVYFMIVLRFIFDWKVNFKFINKENTNPQIVDIA